jgi:hypothetical protein
MKNCNFHHNTFQINQNILVANAMVEQNPSPAQVKMLNSQLDTRVF